MIYKFFYDDDDDFKYTKAFSLSGHNLKQIGLVFTSV